MNALTPRPARGGPPSCALWLLALLPFLQITPARAAAPALDQLFPVAAQAGSTNTVTAVGKFDPWPVQVWVDSPAIVFKPQTNSGRFQVEIATNAVLGPHLVRFFNEQGASNPRFFIVTADPPIAEVETNDSFLNPQMVDTLPASINGRLERADDVDSFGIRLEAGQTLIGALEAYVLASPVDAVLRLVDRRGVQVAINHDDGRTLDPLLAFTAPDAGDYILQVFGFAHPAGSDIRFTGNPKCVYRLQLSRGPYARHTVPLGVSRHGRTHLQVVGWNLDRRTNGIDFDGSTVPADASQVVVRHVSFANELCLAVGEGPELTETEPNNIAADAGHVVVPCAVTGRIEPAGDVDRFLISVKQGETLRLEVQAAAPELDAWLKVESKDGKELKKADDNVGRDPLLEWSAPEEGDFLIAVGNVLHRGGGDYLYRLSVSRPVPSVRVTTASSAFTAEGGKTNELKITVKLLDGAKGKLAASVEGLPEGLRVEPVEVPEKGGDIPLKLPLPPDAKAFSGPIQILVKDEASGKVYRAVNDLVTTGVDNGVPNGFNHLVIESIDQFWLTVPPPKLPKTASTK